MSGQTVRDAMVPEPTTLPVDANAQDAGRAFAENDDVRALFVCEDDGRLVGVLTRKTLVREVVAAGRHPVDVRLRDIAEPPHFTLDASLSLEEGFHQLEENDLERVPVVCLFVRAENAPAIRVYEAIGMRRTISYRSLIF